MTALDTAPAAGEFIISLMHRHCHHVDAVFFHSLCLTMAYATSFATGGAAVSSSLEIKKLCTCEHNLLLPLGDSDDCCTQLP